MKKIIILLGTIVFIVSMSGMAAAIPFQVTDSSLNVDWDSGGGFVSYTGYSMDSPVNLAEGESTQFTFGKIFFPLAWGSGTADFTVDFSTPQFSDPVSNEANFKVWSFFFFSGGNLIFDDPVSFEYTAEDSTSGIMTLDFADIAGIQLGSWINLTGTITNGTAQVPEPATMLLMGVGLIGVVGISRKKLRLNA